MEENRPDNELSSPVEHENDQPVKKKGKLKWILLLFIVLLIFGGIGYHWLRTQYLQLRLQHHNTVINVQQQSLSDQVRQLKTLVVQQGGMIEDNQAALTHFTKLSNSTKSDWISTEAGYLIRMANFSLHFQRNPSMAIALLKTADAYLRGIENIQLLKVRRALAKDIAALEAVPKVDTTGIYLRIQALDDQVQHLPMLAKQTQALSKQPAEHAQKNLSIWKRGLLSTWNSLKQVLIIQHHQQKFEPLIAGHQRTLLELNLHLLFSQAQWAVLHHQAAIYKINLQQAQALIDRYYVQTNAMTAHMDQALKDLQKIDVSPILPEISASQALIKKLNIHQMRKGVKEKQKVQNEKSA